MEEYTVAIVCILILVIGESVDVVIVILNVINWFIVKTEPSVTSLDCNHGLCPQTQGAVTCTITGSVAA